MLVVEYAPIPVTVTVIVVLLHPRDAHEIETLSRDKLDTAHSHIDEFSARLVANRDWKLSFSLGLQFEPT
jgi:hypothetical protein